MNLRNKRTVNKQECRSAHLKDSPLLTYSPSPLSSIDSISRKVMPRFFMLSRKACGHSGGRREGTYGGAWGKHRRIEMGGAMALGCASKALQKSPMYAVVAG